MGRLYIPIENKLWDKIKIGKDNECWECTANPDRHGYGRIADKGKKIFAHRIAYKLYYGILPDDKDVLHKCDNPPCCNPKHLFLGTHKDNMRECAERGRSKNPVFHYEDHPLAKLDWEKVKDIRSNYRGLSGEQKYYSNKYGVTTAAIRNVLTEKTWKQIIKKPILYIYKDETVKLLDNYISEIKLICKRREISFDKLSNVRV